MTPGSSPPGDAPASLTLVQRQSPATGNPSSPDGDAARTALAPLCWSNKTALAHISSLDRLPTIGSGKHRHLFS
ncbi:hypothetical protein LC608_02650 [Nostoc sp. XA010]|uniref:hypothetical protein n=1 Tax=Nostoc sp. XA010 TaxID=2780407 RepID=UPI001E5C6178|nr:hypothetical protein [Nostoc sp. XA010]MCC5655901.1 hypothetical protein [Nostoc sp. XA010]